VLKCAELPEHLRSEISFLRTCNIPNLISYVHGIALSKRFTGCVSTSGVSNTLCVYNLHGCEIACALKQTFAQCTIFLQGTLLVTNFTNLYKHIDKIKKR